MNARFAFLSVFASTLFLIVPLNALASTIWYVDGVHGNDSNNCMSSTTACKTIGHAISLASSGDSIRVAAATYAENLTIGFSLKLIGSGATTTIIDGGAVNTVVTISNGSAQVTLSGLTIRNGLAQAHEGGGVYNVGALTINKCTISGNTATAQPHGLGGKGGGIFNTGSVTINRSALTANFAAGWILGPSFGGGIENFGIVAISGSTFSGNGATIGGGIDNAGTVTISSSTISGNTGVGGIEGGATLQNSIVANNVINCRYGTVISNGYNLSSDNTCNFTGPGDLNNTNPMLGTLGYYGGPTQTIPLLSGSPAIDGGNPGGCTDGSGRLLTTDQRGAPRPDKEDAVGCDMGAFERQSD